MASVAALGFSIISRYNGGGVRQARNDLAELRAQMALVRNDSDRFSKALGSATRGLEGWQKALVAISPALVPLAAQLAATAGALATMTVAAGGAGGAWALALKGAVSRINDTNTGLLGLEKNLAKQKAILSELTPGTGNYEKQLKKVNKAQDMYNHALAGADPAQKGFVQGMLRMDSAWQMFITRTQGQTLGVATKFIDGLAQAIGKLEPLVSAVTPIANQLAVAFQHWVDVRMDGWVSFLVKNGIPALQQFITIGKNLGTVAGIGLKSFANDADHLGNSLAVASAKLKGWAEGGGFQRFLDYVHKNAPDVNKMLKAMMDAIGNIIRILDGFNPGALRLLTDGFRAIAALDPGAVKAFANSFLLLRSPMAWLLVNCPPLRDLIIKILGSMNAQTVYAVAAAFVALRIAFMLMNTALLTTPVGWLILGLTALAVAIVYIATKTTWFQTAWQYTWNFIKTVGSAIWQGLQVAWQATVNALIVAWQTVSGALVTAWNTVWNGISTAVQAIWTGLQTAWNAVVMGLSTAWTTVSGALVTAWNAVWNGISTAVQAIWTGLQTAWNAVCTAFSTAWTTVSTALTAAWQTVWTGLQTAAQVVWTALQTAWSAFITALQTVWTTVSSALTTAWQTVWTGLQTAAQAVWSAIQTAWQAVCTAFQTAWNTVSAALTAAWNTFWNALKTAGQAIWTALQTAWQAVLTAIQTAWTTVSAALTAAWNATWNALKTAANTIWEWMKTTWNAIINAIKTVWDTVSAALKAAWSAAWNAIKSAAESVWNWIKSTWDSITKAVGDIWDKASDALKKAWKATWDTIKSVASSIWDDVKNAVEKGINALLTPINGLIKGFNAIVKAVGLNIDIPEIHVNFAVGGIVGGVPHFSAGGTVDFHSGGVLNGYAPGRDTVPAMLSRGEGVLTPEAVRGLGGPDFVHAANRKWAGHRGAGRGARPEHVKNIGHAHPASQFALGGMVAWRRDNTGWHAATGGITPPPPPGTPASGQGTGTAAGATPPHDATGSTATGNNGDTHPGKKDPPGIGDLVKSILGIENGTTANLVLGFIGKEALDKAILPLIDKIVPNFGKVGEIMGGTAKKIGHGMLDWLIKQDAEKKKEYESMAVAGAKSCDAWMPVIMEALKLTGKPASWAPNLMKTLCKESTGNPNAINNWDINAKNGIPSQGLMQIIPPNFTKYHQPGTSNNILDPLANIAAAINYIAAVYGAPSGGSPYALGTPGATSGVHLVGEKGPELVNFKGGETVTPAGQTSSILTGAGTAPAMAAAPAVAPPMPDVSGMISSAVASGGDAKGVLAQLQEIQDAANAMAVAVQKSWTTVTTSGTQAQAALDPVLAEMIAQHGTAVPQAMTTMSTANTTTWTTMAAQALAQWTAMKAGTFTQAQQTMMTDVPLWLTTMSTQNTAKWTEMGLQSSTQWGTMRDGTFTEANDYMATKMPEWGDQMNQAVSTAWSNMGTSTKTEWDGMKEGTREPTNWIIENSYNNGIRALWNQVAGVIFDDGAKELPSVATLAKGGPVYGPGTGTSDSVPARLSRGEHVWTAKEVRKAGGHHAVMGMRSAVLGGQPVRGAVPGHEGCGFALGGFLGGGVSGSSPSVGQLDLKRGSMSDTTQPILEGISAAAKSALAGSPYRKMGGSSDVLSPADWISQYIKKDDELNKIGSGGPPWVPGVSDVHTTYDGYTVNARTKDMLDMAKGLGASFSVVQGSFSTGVAASAGTHDGGGVVDVVPAGDANVGPLRAVGFAAWSRGAAYGSPSFAEHIHAVAQGDPTVSPAAASQIQSYLAGGNGLADGGPDNFHGSIPTATGVGGIAGGGNKVDPKDLTQNTVSFDRGGLLQPGYTMAFNGTGKPEPVGHDLVRRGEIGNVTFEIHAHGEAKAEDIVAALNADALPKLRTLLTKGTGS